MTDDYAQLVARLREASDNTSMNMALLREAANVIEWLDPDAEHNTWRNSEIRKLQVRLRAVEKACGDLVARFALTEQAYHMHPLLTDQLRGVATVRLWRRRAPHSVERREPRVE